MFWFSTNFSNLSEFFQVWKFDVLIFNEFFKLIRIFSGMKVWRFDFQRIFQTYPDFFMYESLIFLILIEFVKAYLDYFIYENLSEAPLKFDFLIFIEFVKLIRILISMKVWLLIFKEFVELIRIFSGMKNRSDAPLKFDSLIFLEFVKLIRILSKLSGVFLPWDRKKWSKLKGGQSYPSQT